MLYSQFDRRTLATAIYRGDAKLHLLILKLNGWFLYLYKKPHFNKFATIIVPFNEHYDVQNCS